MGAIWDIWIWVAIAVPVLYALDCVLDVFFVDKKFYRDPIHASIITGLFSGVVLLLFLPGHEQFLLPEFPVLFMALANGVIYLLHIYFYFKALFKLNDAANLETFLGFSVLLVPLLAFILLNQQLGPNQLLGIGSALFGVIVLAIANLYRGRFSTTLIIMSNAIVLLSITFVIQDEIYTHVNFYTGLVLFLAGKFIAAIILWTGSECKGVIADAKKFTGLFVFSQLLGIAAVVFAQRAINISPSITVVAAIEAITPFFIMLFSLMLLPFIKGKSNPDRANRRMLRLQLQKVPAKIIATVFLITGIVMISSPPDRDLWANEIKVDFPALSCCSSTTSE